MVEGINKIGSAFYGPILAAFTVGVLTKRATGVGVVVGVLLGVCANLALWLGAPSVHWMWMNVLGLAVSVTTTMVVSAFGTPKEGIEQYTLTLAGIREAEGPWMKVYLGLFAWFGVIVLVCATLHLFVG